MGHEITSAQLRECIEAIKLSPETEFLKMVRAQPVGAVIDVYEGLADSWVPSVHGCIVCQQNRYLLNGEKQICLDDHHHDFMAAENGIVRNFRHDFTHIDFSGNMKTFFSEVDLPKELKFSDKWGVFGDDVYAQFGDTIFKNDFDHPVVLGVGDYEWNVGTRGVVVQREEGRFFRNNDPNDLICAVDEPCLESWALIPKGILTQHSTLGQPFFLNNQPMEFCLDLEEKAWDAHPQVPGIYLATKESSLDKMCKIQLLVC